MAKKIWKGGALLSPLPAVMVTSKLGDKINVCTASWTGITSTKPPKCFVSLRPTRLTHEYISATREFCINLPSSRLVRITDACGVKSGRETDKFALFDISAEPSSAVDCPSVVECPVVLECKVTDIVPLGSHDMFIADIVAVRVDEKLIDESGKLRMEKAGLFAYSHGSYYAMGKKIGQFGFSVKKRKKKS